MTVSSRSLCIAEVSPATNEEWDAAYRSCDYATYFHSRMWAEYFERLRPRSVSRAACVVSFSDGRRAILPLARQARANGLLDVFASSVDSNVGGWISADGLGPAHAELLTDYLLTGLDCSLMWRINPYDPHVAQILAQVRRRAAQVVASQPKSAKVACCVKNWRKPLLIEDQTHALDLSRGFGELFGPQRAVARKAKKASKAGVEIRLAERNEEWEEYFGVYQSSVARWGRDPNDTYPWQMFRMVLDSDPAERRLWTARYDGKIVCGAVCFYAKRHVVYWHGSALSEYFELRPVNLMMQEIVRHACAEGYRWYDFNPSGFLSGVIAFKESFGAKALPAPQIFVDDNVRRATRALMFGARGY